jgi:hypothetical protein
MTAGPVRRITGDSFYAWDGEVVFDRENVDKQLRIRAPKRLPAVLADAVTAATASAELEL